MMTRRSILRGKNEFQNETSMHSILFPESYRSRPNIVPESPVSGHAGISTASVLDTPDKSISENLAFGESSTNKKSGLRSRRFSLLNESTLIGVTPDLKLNNQKRFIVMLEDDSSLNIGNTLNNVDTSNPRRKNLDKKRKSLIEKILPFDLNDEKSLQQKLQNINELNLRRRSVSRPRSLQITLDDEEARCNYRHKKLRSSNSGDKSRAKESLQGNSTIFFENTNNELDLTSAHDTHGIMLPKGKERPFTMFDSSDESYDARTSQLSMRDDQQNASSNLSICRPLFNESLPGELSPLNKGIFMLDESVNDTQPISIIVLQGVKAYVDVRSGAENRSGPVKEVLSSLGATIFDKFTMEVTHVVFRDGSMATYQRSVQRGVHLVSPLWVEACRVKLVRVSEGLFPISSDYSKNPTLGPNTKQRKMRSMQPREFEEDEKIVAARLRKRLHAVSASSPESSSPLQKSSTKALTSHINSPLLGIGIEQLLTPTSDNNEPGTSEASSEEKEYNTPLATRMYKRFFSPLSNLAQSKEEPRQVPLIPLRSEINIPPDEVPGSREEAVFQSEEAAGALHKKPFPNKKRRSKRLNKLHLSFSDEGQERETVDKLPVISSPAKKSKENCEQIEKTKKKRILKTVSTKASDGCKNVHFGGSREETDVTSKEALLNRDTASSTDGENEMSGGLALPAASQSSSSCKRRLHTVDCYVALSQELIVPKTPDSSGKQSCPYDEFRIHESMTQRKALRNLNRKELADCTALPLPRKMRRRTLPDSSSESSSATPSKEELPKEATQRGKVSLIPTTRKSLEEFATRRKSKNSTKMNPKRPASSICLTSFHSHDLPSVYSIIKSLGGFLVSEEVDENTSHVVCGSERRTLNVLLGIARGAWILDVSWLYESVEMLSWAPEEPFELFNFCPGARIGRLEKDSASKRGLFNGVGRVFVLDSCAASAIVVRDLLQQCSANLCWTIRSADVVVGMDKVEGSTILQVSERWVFDSVQFWQVKDFNDYIIQ